MLALLFLACSQPDTSAQVRARAGAGGSRGDSASDSESDTAPAVQFVSPSDGATVTNPVTFSLTAANVATVSLDADGYSLGDAWVPAETASTVYTFDGTGYPRVITAHGYNADGAEVAQDSITVTVQAPGVHLAVPYFYQMDNTYEPTGTCGLTSGAMLIDYWHPGSVTPDSLYVDHGKSQGQSPAGLVALYEAEGLQWRYGLTATRAGLRTELDAGRPVIVHGYFTSSGHIVVIVGYDEGGWYANDSAGDWAEGYFNADGQGVYYALGGGWDDALGSDGDIWYSAADVEAF